MFEIVKDVRSAEKRGSPIAVETAQDMARAAGYETPEDVNFAFGNPGSENWASYNPSTSPKSEIVSWDEYFQGGKFQITVDRGVLWDPQKAMRMVVHELYEINGLRKAFESAGGKMSREAVEATINRLHQEAIQVEKAAWERWKSLPKRQQLTQ